MLASRGFDAAGIGLVLTVALVSGAMLSMATGALERRFGRRATLIAGSVTMALAGVLLATAHAPSAFIFAALLGTISPSGQEVGPFAALEQAIVAEATAGSATRRFAHYNVVGTFAAAFGALFAAFVSPPVTLYAYALAGVALAVLYTRVPRRQATPAHHVEIPRQPLRFGIVERLTLLFGVDAIAGGFVVQSFVAYWLHLRFGVDIRFLGELLFGANVLSALSFLVAAPLAERFGLLPTMVFTHLPSNVLLLLLPLAPTFPIAALVLLARYALSQMDVPTRQAYTMAIVAPQERARAAGLTNAVRPAAAALSPLLAGLAVQGAVLGLPFYLAGGLKIAYDLTLFAVFRGVALEDTDA